jgi:hypothetical protein
MRDPEHPEHPVAEWVTIWARISFSTPAELWMLGFCRNWVLMPRKSLLVWAEESYEIKDFQIPV